MLRQANFRCEFHSLDSPPATKYVATQGDEGDVEIEFITDAPGASEAAIMVQPDLSARELHYVGLLFESPWPVDLADLTDGKVDLTILARTRLRSAASKKKHDQLLRGESSQ